MIKDTRLRILTTIGLGGNNSSKKPAALVRPEDAMLGSPQDKVKVQEWRIMI